RSGQVVVPVLLHQREQAGLRAGLVVAPRLTFHGCPAGVSLDAASPAASALRTAELDHHVAELPGGATPQPAVFLDHDRATDASSPPEAEKRPQGPAGAQHCFPLDGGADVVPDPDRDPEAARKRLGEPKPVHPARKVACVRAGSVCLAADARGPAPAPRQLADLAPGRVRGSLQCLCHRGRALRGAAALRGRPTRLSRDRVALVGDDGLDLRATEVDAASHEMTLSIGFAYDPQLWRPTTRRSASTRTSSRCSLSTTDSR